MAGTIQSQQRSILSEYPELRKPVVQGQAVEGEMTPTIIAVCSQTKPRTAEVIIEWPGQLRSFENLRLDVTFYKQGFSTNRFAVLWPIEKSKKARVIDQNMLRQPEVASGLELQQVALSRGDAGKNALLKLEGLDAGKTYFWRFLTQGAKEWQAGNVIRIEAPTCPVDFIERQ